MISEQVVIEAFTSKLAEYGVRLADTSRLKLDGNWHRARVDGDRGGSLNLSYKIYFDDRPAGFFQDHKRGFSDTFSVANGQDLSPAEREAARAAWAARQREREAEQRQSYLEAAKRAQAAVQAATGDPAAHPYIVKKGIRPDPTAVKVDADGNLVIPVYSTFGTIASLQTVSADGEKLFLLGGQMAGSFHPIKGEDRRRVLVTEGYATGAALNRETGHSVACAMSSGNLEAVARKMQAAFPDREIVICADNDHETAARIGRNPGLEAAQRAADALGCRVVAPQFLDGDPGTDWDDWLRAGGDPDVLRWQIEGEPDYEPEPDSVEVPQEPELAAPAISGTVVDLPAKPAEISYATQSWTQLGLELGNNGVPSPNLTNAVAILERHHTFAGLFWFDEFLGRVLTTWNPERAEREWSDADDIRLALTMQRTHRIGRMAVGTVRDAVTAVAMAHRRNECKEWLNALCWDGTERLPELLERGFGTPRNEYTEAVGRCWVVSMAARVVEPGCKVDTMPVFEGMQGRGKSTALQVLVGSRWFAEAAESPTSKDFFQALQGKMLVEIGEMDAFSRGEVTAVKRVISCQSDRYRAPYGRRAEDHPRMCVFAGTTNKDDWNRDETGARRFWPVACGNIDLAWIAINREQLFAEAMHRLRAREQWWNVPAEDALREQEARRDTDEWEAVVGDWLHTAFKDETTVGEVLGKALKMEPESWDKQSQMRAAKALKALGWTRVTARRGGNVVKVWTLDKQTEVGGNGGNKIPI